MTWFKKSAPPPKYQPGENAPIQPTEKAPEYGFRMMYDDVTSRFVEQLAFYLNRRGMFS